MDRQSIESKSKKADGKRDELVKLSELEVRSTELTFITSVDYPTGQLFAQFCKFSNEELLFCNHSINEYCVNIINQRQAGDSSVGVPKKVRTGNILCVKYHRDGTWYRAQVLGCNKEDQTCTVRFIDFGNKEIVGADELLEVDPKQLPIMGRTPFGIICTAPGFESETKRLLDCLSNQYVMIKPIERCPLGDWKIRIPKNAYNVPFWLTFEPDVVIEDYGQNKIDTDDRLKVASY